MSVRVRYHGRLAELAGCADEPFEAADTAALLAAVVARHPELHGQPLLLAVDGTLAMQPRDLPADAVVSLMPPFSGG